MPMDGWSVRARGGSVRDDVLDIGGDGHVLLNPQHKTIDEGIEKWDNIIIALDNAIAHAFKKRSELMDSLLVDNSES